MKRICIVAAQLSIALPGSACAATIEAFVSVDASLDRASVRVVSSEPIYRLEARSDAARRELVSATDCRGEALSVSRRRIDAGGLACVDYETGLVGGVRRAPSLSGDALVTAARDWLWLPSRREAPDTVRVSFELPEPLSVSAPWRPLDDGTSYEIEPRPSSGRTYVVFGRFDEWRVAGGGSELRVADLAARTPAERERLRRWLGAAADNVATLYGRLPATAPQVLLLPASGRGGSPVPFGMVSRRGGESVLFYVDAGRPLSDLKSDWTATHEFAHLLLPYVREKWISEGFATYLQNVLLARGGAYTQEKAWQRLAAGFGRGESSVPEMSPRAASRRGGYGATMKVYWSGAWLALAADVELRRRSGGTQSLARALDELADCCLPATRSFSGPELMRKLDGLSGGLGVFSELYAATADRDGFPDYDDLLARLGVSVDGRNVSLGDDAPLAAIRATLMAPVSAAQP